MSKVGFSDDFAKVMSDIGGLGPQGISRQVPPTHPSITTDAERDAVINSRFAQAGMKADKMRCEVGFYDLSNEEERDAYNSVVTNSLQKGWLLVRDEWHPTHDGRVVAATKCLIPDKIKKEAKKET